MFQYKQNDNGRYILSRDHIDQIATDKLLEYVPMNLETPTPLNTIDFLENKLGLTIKYKYICDPESGILGLTVMDDIVPIPSCDEELRPTVIEETFGTVLITPKLFGRSNQHRLRYTQMHEASHFILHQPYFDKLKNSNNRITYNKTFVACSKVGDSGLAPRTESEWLEYQADALAAALLMPKKTFTSYAIDLFRKYGVQGRHITNQANRKNYNIIEDISQKFMVSKQAAQIRLTHLGLIKE